MPESPTSKASKHPDYARLIKFLVQPFLESPDSLKIDCEVSSSKPRTWVRLAFEASDKGRIFGRGGRNIQAIRSVLEASAQIAGQTAHLDVYGSSSQSRHDESEPESAVEKPHSPRDSGQKGSPRLRSR